MLTLIISNSKIIVKIWKGIKTMRNRRYKRKFQNSNYQTLNIIFKTLFLLVILSAAFKTDKMNFKKVIAILLGMISITGIYFIK